jgi:hypothetical protein
VALLPCRYEECEEMTLDSSVVSRVRLPEEDFDSLEEPKVWGLHGSFSLVGNGDVTNSRCGTFKSFWGCVRVELHDLITLDGVNHEGKVYVQKVFNSCDKPSCPVCYKKGWAVREAGRIEARLKVAAMRFGQVEHIVCSVPLKDYGLDLKRLRKKVIGVLSSCGVVGGCIIFHGFRYRRLKGWYWNVHFHVLGFILGGYGRCRHCTGGNCYTCNGVEGRLYRAYRENGYIVRVLGERKTVGGTAWYQLNHATVKVGVKCFCVATWFGVCSYRKLKVSPEVRRRFCPICQHELERLRYFGRKDWFSGEFENKSKFEADYCEDGRTVWLVYTRFEGSGG